jgi:hypothetical protein
MDSMISLSIIGGNGGNNKVIKKEERREKFIIYSRLFHIYDILLLYCLFR